MLRAWDMVLGFGSLSVILGVNDLQLSLCLVGELEHFLPRGHDFLLFPTHLIYVPTEAEKSL